jgi:hypothetical protein
VGRRRPGPRPTELNATTIQDSGSATDRVTWANATPGLLAIEISPRWYRDSATATAAAATIPIQSMIPKRRAEGRPIVASPIEPRRLGRFSQDSIDFHRSWCCPAVVAEDSTDG